MTEIMPKMCKNPFSTLLAHSTVRSHSQRVNDQQVSILLRICLPDTVREPEYFTEYLAHARTD